MTDDQPTQEPGAGEPAAVPPAAPPPVEGSGWVQPAPAAAPPPVEGSGWVQPAAPPAAGPAWGQPPAGPPAAPAPTGWAQPPAPTPGWVQPALNQKGSVTILARLAGVVLVLLGLFWGAAGVILIIGGSAFRSIFDQLGGPLSTDTNSVDAAGNIVGGVFVGIGIVILILAIVEVLGGIGTIIGKTWGRIIGILYSLVFGSFLLLGGSGASRASDVTDTSGAGGGLIFLLVMFLLYLYALVVLIVRWRGRAHA